MFARLIIYAAIVASSTEMLRAQEWTRFRGPNGCGQIDGVQLPAKWTSENFNWKIKLPGIGHSCPVLWGKKIFLLSADPDDATRYVLCINANSGSILWKNDFASQHHHLHARNSFASSTPAVDAKHVYVAWSTPEHITFMAFTHGGDVVWERELGPFASQHGFGTSPVVFEDLVVLCNSQMKPERNGPRIQSSSIIAVDRNSGETRWKSDRMSDKAAYSVPCLFKADGPHPEMVSCSTVDGIFSFNPRTGQENWSVNDAFSMRTVSSPVIYKNLVFGSTGSGGGGNYVVAVRVDGDSAAIEYKVESPAPYVPTSVLRGDLLFLWADNGIVTCVDAATGNEHWQKRVGGNYSGSPIRVGDKIYCVSDAGELVTLAAEDKYQLLGRTQLGEDSRSTPACADGKMYLRTYSHLISVGG